MLLTLALQVTAFPQENDSNAESSNETEHESWKLERGAKEISFEFGFAPMQPTFLSGREEYDTDGRKLALGTFRWGRVIGTTRGVTFEYLFEAMPIATAIRNEVRNPLHTPDGK